MYIGLSLKRDHFISFSACILLAVVLPGAGQAEAFFAPGTYRKQRPLQGRFSHKTRFDAQGKPLMTSAGPLCSQPCRAPPSAKPFEVYDAPPSGLSSETPPPRGLALRGCFFGATTPGN